MERLERIRQIADRVAVSEGMELVDVELRGHGPRTILLIFLDKPGGINHGDCKLVSEQVGAILDVEDLMGSRYTLEVSSPGLDRRLVKPEDYQRFAGHRVKLALKAPRDGQRFFQGRLLGMEEGVIRVDAGQGRIVAVACGDIKRANLIAEF